MAKDNYFILLYDPIINDHDLQRETLFIHSMAAKKGTYPSQPATHCYITN